MKVCKFAPVVEEAAAVVVAATAALYLKACVRYVHFLYIKGRKKKNVYCLPKWWCSRLFGQHSWMNR